MTYHSHQLVAVCSILVTCSGCITGSMEQYPVAVAPLTEGDLETRLRRVKLEEATLQETVNEVRRQWSKARGGSPVPPITIVGQAADGTGAYRPTITCDLANVPGAEFLRYIRPATGYRAEVVAEEDPAESASARDY